MCIFIDVSHASFFSALMRHQWVQNCFTTHQFKSIKRRGGGKKSNFDGNTHTAKGSCITFIFCCMLLSPTLVKYSLETRWSTFNFPTYNNLLYLLSNYWSLLYSNLFFDFFHSLCMGGLTTHELKSKSVCISYLFLNWLRHSARNLKNIFRKTQMGFLENPMRTI